MGRVIWSSPAVLNAFFAPNLFGGDRGRFADVLSAAVPQFVREGRGVVQSPPSAGVGRPVQARAGDVCFPVSAFAHADPFLLAQKDVASSEAGDRAAGAASGLVSFGNKVNTQGDPLFVPDYSNKLKRSRRMVRGVLHTARVLSESLRSSGVKFRSAFITLTYRDGVEWAASHIRDLLRLYRLWCARRKVEFRYVWVLELTKQGRPHYHIVMFLPYGITPPLPDKQGWWPHGMTQAKWARSPVGYIAKYASKGNDGRGELPKGARVWGSGGVSRDIRPMIRWALAPSWVRFVSGNPSEQVRHRTSAKDGDSWWEFPERGFRCASPWDYDCSIGVVRWRGWTSWDVEFFDPSNSSEG